MRDGLRYTVVQDSANTEAYQAAVQGTVDGLKTAGYVPFQASDYWTASQGYAGLHTNWTSPDGQQKIELQFHTPASISTKEEISHPLYVELRKLEVNDVQAQGLRDRIDSAWRTVRETPPPNLDSYLAGVFPVVYQK